MTKTQMMNAYQQLADFAYRTTLNDIPTDVVDRAIMVLRDTIGVIIGGYQAQEVASLIHYGVENYSGHATLIGTNRTVRTEWATLIYGTAGTTLEFDEGHAFARGHAAIHAVSTALALASAMNLSGENLITALIIGYEITARIGVASRLRDGVHPFGTWGVIGSAIIGAKFANFNPEEMLDVMELASSYAIAPSFNTAFQGKNVRNTYAGIVNHNGLLAVEMYKLGFRGEQGAIDTTFGQLLGESFDSNQLTSNLGSRYEMMRGYFKPYSACRYSHAAIDASLQLRDICPDEITAITVETYDIASKLTSQQPDTPLAARFSIPYIVAVTLLEGSANEKSFTEDALKRDDIQELAKKVTVLENADYTALLPDKRATKVTIHTHNTTLSAEAIGSKGDPDQPMSTDELKQKFLNLTSSLTPSHQNKIWSICGEITLYETLDDLFAHTA